MPRRRPSSKGKSTSKARPVDRKDSKIKRWNKPSDIELDEEDQFHASRDKILLEGDEVYDDEDDDEDEVFALKGLSDEEEEDEEPSEGDDDEDVDVDVGTTEGKKSKSSKSKSKTKSKKKHASSSSESEEEEEETWGRSKAAYYSSNAAELESDDDEANELEEQEARRLQTKARDVILEEDFGFGEVVAGDEHTEETDILMEESEVSKPSLPQDKKSLIRYLEKENPEALALARDWDDTAWNLVQTQAKIVQLESEDPDAVSLGMIHLYYQALLTYATTLAFYLHLRASPKYSSHPELLRDHPVLSRLLTLKQAVATLDDLDFNASDEEDEDDDDDDDDMVDLDGLDQEALLEDMQNLWNAKGKKALEMGELEELLMDASRSKSKSKSKSSTSLKADLDDSELSVKPPKKKRKTAEKAAPVFDLVEPEFSSSSSRKKPTSFGDTNNADAFGEATFLQHADAADKKARKKSLQFHVSRIDSASARRQGARANALGGDDDIPYRERRKDREAKLAKEQERNKARLGMGGDDLDDVDPELETDGKKEKKKRKEMDDEADEDEVDGYYELVKRQATEKKMKKKMDYEVAQAAARPDFNSNEMDGPRSITRAIMKNRGLTPHRSKSVRNPRVKKRQKFEKAKKKVSSQKAVYKGGIGDASKYAGEQSGISKVVKSVRLG
ncbi:hypothetical protein SERLA73DRAFT_173106 [Serpula lacrymans var. lacrymans S7.3]|uniref:Sas10 C-terminal domain-containing protein n=1 Tax=Serpula lacrymans var. lacrymans (strain S7.3) TaxID=936435 RepID=F8QHT7_SERL3|nr:hypothetical protein SERLA73DRAFT_173106 [Serpula lacrymans var. lacrymans S7.3]